MLDLEFIRQNSKLVEKNAKNKRVNVDIEYVLKSDEQNRQLITAIGKLRSELNSKSKVKPDKKTINELKKLGQEIKELEIKQKEAEEILKKILYKIPNIASDDTPIGKDESGNVVLREAGERQHYDFKLKEHWELAKKLDLAEFDKAAAISGSRFFYLKNELALLQFAIINFTFSTLADELALAAIAKKALLNVSIKPFIPVVPPVFIKPEVMEKMARLEPKEERYYISSDDQYLVGSAEHTLGPLHMDEILDKKSLPIRYIGYSSAFRREAGSYGKDTKGMIRVHQFDKLEMESFTAPEDSLNEQNFIVAIQEYLMSSLKIPYRVVSICTGDMGGPDARQIDIEAWLPGLNTYKETHTSDLMTDYQTRRLKTRVKLDDGKVVFVHTNDATAFAIGRTLVAIMENYQQADGSIVIPEVLQKYMGGLKIIKR